MSGRPKHEIMAGVPHDRARLVARSTAEYHHDGRRVIRLHRTDILTFHPDGTVSIALDGWDTVTTRDRLNRFLPLPLRIYSDRGVLRLQRDGRYEPEVPRCAELRVDTRPPHAYDYPGSSLYSARPLSPGEPGPTPAEAAQVAARGHRRARRWAEAIA